MQRLPFCFVADSRISRQELTDIVMAVLSFRFHSLKLATQCANYPVLKHSALGHFDRCLPANSNLCYFSTEAFMLPELLSVLASSPVPVPAMTMRGCHCVKMPRMSSAR